MPLPWPTFTTWTRIREEDRAALSDMLAELLAHGALIGDAGRDRELYLLAREYEPELREYLAPLHLLLVPDSDRPIFLLRPVPGDCGLLARFNKAETLLVLTLWRIYHDARMEQAVEAVVLTANDIWQRLKLYFEKIELPTPAQLRDRCAPDGAFRERLNCDRFSSGRKMQATGILACARHFQWIRMVLASGTSGYFDGGTGDLS